MSFVGFIVCIFFKNYLFLDDCYSIYCCNVVRKVVRRSRYSCDVFFIVVISVMGF